jgi:uncharacterized protein (UPF0333 family)
MHVATIIYPLIVIFFIVKPDYPHIQKKTLHVGNVRINSYKTELKIVKEKKSRIPSSTFYLITEIPTKFYLIPKNAYIIMV